MMHHEDARANVETTTVASPRIIVEMNAPGAWPFTDKWSTGYARSDSKEVELLIGQIPCHLSKQRIIDAVNHKGLGSKYSHIHMPLNPSSMSRNQNLGFFFVTVGTNNDADEFKNAFNGFIFAGAKAACEVVIVRESPESNEIARENCCNDDDSSPAKADSEDHRNRGEDMQGMVSTAPLDVCVNVHSKYRPSKLMRAQSMESPEFEFEDAWAEMPQEQEGRKSQSRESLISSSAMKSNVSNFSNIDSNRSLTHPSSNKKLLWDVLGSCFIGLEVFVLPPQIFIDPIKEIALLYITLNLSSLVYWSVDIFASLIRASYVNNGDLERCKLLTSWKYLKFWFPIDLICVSVEIFSLVAPGLKSIRRLVCIVKVLKLFCMVWNFKINERITCSEVRIRSEAILIMMRIVNFLFFFCFSCYCMAYGWWAVGRYYNTNNFNWMNSALPSGSIGDTSFCFRYFVCFDLALSQYVASSEIFPTNTASGAVVLLGFGSMIAGMTSRILEITENCIRNNKDDLQIRRLMHQKATLSKLPAQAWTYLWVSKRSNSQVLQSNEIGLIKSMPKTMFQYMCACINLLSIRMHQLFQYCFVVCPHVMKKDIGCLAGSLTTQRRDLDPGNPTATHDQDAHASVEITSAANPKVVVDMNTAGTWSFTEKLSERHAKDNFEKVQLMIGRIPYNFYKEQIIDVVNQQGLANKFLDIHLPLNSNSMSRNQNLGYFFVTLGNRNDAIQFKHAFNGFIFAGAKTACEVDIIHAKISESDNLRTSDGPMTVNNWVKGSASLCVAQLKIRGNNEGEFANRRSQNKSEFIETVMLRGVPKTWGKTLLMNELDTSGYVGKYNFIYVPSNSKNDIMENNGYAFVNFMYAFPTVYGKSLKVLRSKFHLQPAKIQGLQANMDFFRHKGVRFIHKDVEFAPHVKCGDAFSVIKHSRNLFPLNHA